MVKLAIFASGSGTNFENIITTMQNGKLKNAVCELLIVDKEHAYAIERAKKLNIPYLYVNPKAYANKEEYETEILKHLKDKGVQLIVLAGYMRFIGKVLLEAYPKRIINIHPSLIPSFCGVGFYGLHVHEGVLARGVKVSGATVHFVDTGTDTGPIILQKAVEVQQGDTPEVLQRRVMEEAEWKILPKAIDLIANNRVSVQNGKVVID